jgi:hypothetical protein
MQSPAFNSYRYEYRKGGDHKELQWARERGIDLRGFTLGLEGVYRSGPVLAKLMGGGGYREKNLDDLDIATYYAKRGKLTHVDEGDGMFIGRTALTCACDKGCSEMVECLLAAGADTEKAYWNGYTPLIHAAMNGHVEVVRLLLSAGADTDKADKDGYTPLIEAALYGHVEVARLLLSAGADTEKADKDGYTPLIEAAIKGHVEVVRLLLSAGADTERANKDGCTPLICATQRHHEEIIQLLQGKSQW